MYKVLIRETVHFNHELVENIWDRHCRDISIFQYFIDHCKWDKMQKPHLPPYSKKPSAATNDTPEEGKENFI